MFVRPVPLLTPIITVLDADGLVGALKINGPTSMNYDVDLGPVLLTDNFHQTAFSQVGLEYLGSSHIKSRAQP